MEDHSQAISFANSYFSLVDGLAPGLKDHLAENVVLDWFGRTIRGRKNVTAFMKAHKVASRHVFNNVTPVPGINYRKSQVSRKLQRPKIDNYVSSLMKRELNLDKLSIRDVDPDNNNVVSTAPGIVDAEGNLQQVIDNDEVSMTYELHENDLANLFALEITPTREEDIEENIKKIKNEERIQFAKRNAARTEYGQGDGPDAVESVCTVKYVEANGHIEFSKKSHKRGTELQTWRRQSKLQIAYSLITSELCPDHDDQEMETEDVSVPETGHRAPLLPSLGEITEISNNLVPNINNFGGYFSSFDFTTERDNFLENFNAELTVRNARASLRTPQYVENRLVFGDNFNNKPRALDKCEDNRFVFNYLIHLIIYQGSSRCRRSLSQEFDTPIKQEKKRFLAELEF